MSLVLWKHSKAWARNCHQHKAQWGHGLPRAEPSSTLNPAVLVGIGLRREHRFSLQRLRRGRMHCSVFWRVLSQGLFFIDATSIITKLYELILPGSMHITLTRVRNCKLPVAAENTSCLLRILNPPELKRHWVSVLGLHSVHLHHLMLNPALVFSTAWYPVCKASAAFPEPVPPSHCSYSSCTARFSSGTSVWRDSYNLSTCWSCSLLDSPSSLIWPPPFKQPVCNKWRKRHWVYQKKETPNNCS